MEASIVRPRIQIKLPLPPVKHIDQADFIVSIRIVEGIVLYAYPGHPSARYPPGWSE